MVNVHTIYARTKSAFIAVMVIGGAMAANPAYSEHASFKNEIFPILKKSCVECHQPGGEGYEKSGLNMTTYEGIMKGTRHGPIVVPGDAFLSNLNVLIEGRAARHLRMPYHGKELSKWDRHMIRRWVNRGAKNN